MPTKFTDRGTGFISGIARFIPAAIFFASAIPFRHPAIFLLLLAANSLLMAAICRNLGITRHSDFFTVIFRHALPYFVLLIGYCALVAGLMLYPTARLISDHSLGATLAVSTSVVIALLSIWRLWPAFALVFFPYPLLRIHRTRAHGSRLRHSIAAAWRITRDNELYFTHGIVVALCLLVLAQGAMQLAGIGGLVPDEYRTAAIAIYAVAVSTGAQLLIFNRCLRAVMVDNQRVRSRLVRVVSKSKPQYIEEVPSALPPDLSPSALNDMLLNCIRSMQTTLALAALEKGADPNAVPAETERDQRSAVVLAAVCPDLRILRGLIERGVDLNQSHAGLPPLIAATRDSYQGRADAVMMLLTNGADVRCTDADGNTPLHFAALSAQPIVAALLCDADANINAVNRDGLTPLATACTAANWPLLTFLLDRGARMEVEHAQPALIAAAAPAEDDPHGVLALLKRKARVDTHDALDRTALMVAALHGHGAIVSALLSAGARVDCIDRRGTTALMEAARSGSDSALAAIAARGAALDQVDALGRTALIIASQSRHFSEQTVRRLLELGAEAHVATPEGRRAVDFAAAAGRWNLVALLDPSYVRPATLLDGDMSSSPPQVDSPAHLLDALRFGHWHIVEKYTASVATWSAAVRAQMFIDLATLDDPAPRHWLLNHGLDVDERFENGTSLTNALLGLMPQTLPGLSDLHAAGAACSGGQVLPRVCSSIAAGQAGASALALTLVERGAEIFACDEEGRSPLMHAVASASVPLVRELLDRGVNPNVRDRRGRSALFDAIELPGATAIAIVKALIVAGADPEAAAANGETALGLALANSELRLRHWLHWPLWKLPRRRLRTSDLPSAATLGDSEAVDKLLDLDLPIDGIDAQGANALLRAAGSGHAALVAHLLDRGADPAYAAPSGATALSAAVSARREAAVETLLTRGMAVDHRLAGGGTALMIAAALGFPEIVERLLAHGADVNLEDERGTRALHAAAQFAFQTRDGVRARRLFEVLLDRSPKLDVLNSTGQTALLLLLGARAEPGSAADQQHLIALLAPLLARRVDLTVQDRRGVSALHACAMHGLLLPARTLLAAGANPELRDGLDRTPREIAHLLGYIDVAAELGMGTVPGVRQTLRMPARELE